MKRARLGMVVVAFFLAACAPVVRPSARLSPPPPSLPVVTSADAPRGEPIVAAFVAPGTLEATSDATKTRLALESLGITAKTTGDVAETTATHVFRNDSSEVLEGTFRFPLPEGAILTGLAMEIDGRLVEGELVERDKARKAYESVVDEMRDPALLEWENGQTFKLRVFPIEPNKNKRVVIRFVAPLHRAAFYAIRPPTSEWGIALEKTTVTVDGKPVALGGARAASGDILVPVSGAAGRGGDVVSEKTKDGTYWAVHVHPSFDGVPARAPKGGQALIVLCDRSRSMLEARALQKKTLGMLLDRLGEADRFTVALGDVTTRELGELRPADDRAKAAALDFVDGTEPDGASDVGRLVASSSRAIASARAAGLEPVVVYLGDGTATWGETRAAELERVAREATHGATMHVVLLGKSTDELVARALAAGAHGRLVRPKTEADAARAASEIALARTLRRIEGVHLVGADELDVPQALPATLYEGDELAIVLRGSAAPSKGEGVALAGTQGDRPFLQKLALGSAVPAGHVAQRWAKAKIEAYEREGDAHKDEVVRTSLESGVMSRYTAFLVLDSEEAYARFQIARKTKSASSGEAAVTGKDLDGDARGASISPDHLQPGDPEVRIPAPADAQSVVVVFPFGETKTATYEQDDGAGHGGMWVVRFLVDRRTPDGSYEIVVRITRKDGRVEILRLPYVVDTQRPNVDVTITPKHDGSFSIHAKQRLSDAEVEAQSPSSLGTTAERRERFAHVLTDAKRVEVQTPDGQTLSLTHVKLGEFSGTWRPQPGAAHGGKLRFVAVDRALNESIVEVEAPR